MRTGFCRLVNPATSIKDHQGAPSRHARYLAEAIGIARTPAEKAKAVDMAEDWADRTTYVPDRRYLDKVLSQ